MVKFVDLIRNQTRLINCLMDQVGFKTNPTHINSPQVSLPLLELGLADPGGDGIAQAATARSEDGTLTTTVEDGSETKSRR